MKKILFGLITLSFYNFNLAQADTAKCSVLSSSGEEVLKTTITSKNPISRSFLVNEKKYVIQSGRFIDESLDVWVKSEFSDKEQVGRYQQEVILSLRVQLPAGQQALNENEIENLILICSQ